jgi:alpha-ketoglutarate-dependent taurine dioxygenase
MSVQERAGFGFTSGRRKTVSVDQRSLVKSSFLNGGGPFLLVLEPNVEAFNLVSWAAAQRQEIERLLLAHGGILFRGFNVESAQQFREFAGVIAGDLIDYNERAAPRQEVGKSVYTSTEFTADQHIPMHHEMSYSHNWPTKIWFYCAQPAASGGRTPVADDRQVLDRIDPAVRRRFSEKKVMYVRNYGEGVDLTWQEAFQTTDKAVVEEYCRKARMTCEWKDRDRLRTRTVRPSTVVHPRTGDAIWFNHAHMFHVSNLQPAVREALLAEFREDELPRNAFYGDGSPIETSVLDEIRGIYEEVALRFDWSQAPMAASPSPGRARSWWPWRSCTRARSRPEQEPPPGAGRTRGAARSDNHPV